MFPNWSLKVLMMFDSRSSSASGFSTAARGGHQLNRRVLVGQLDPPRRLLLNPIADW